MYHEAMRKFNRFGAQIHPTLNLQDLQTQGDFYDSPHLRLLRLRHNHGLPG